MNNNLNLYEKDKKSKYCGYVIQLKILRIKFMLIHFY